MKKFITIFILTLFVLLLGACGSTETTGVAYGMTHKDYVGVATVTVKAEAVTDASFEEYYLPNTWAQLKAVNEGTVSTDVIVIDELWYGKYLVIADKHFTGSLRDTSLVVEGITYANQKIKYSAEGIADLFIWLKANEENKKWYADELEAENAFIAKADFTKIEYEPVIKNGSKLGFKKSNTNYWKGSNYPLGWAGNMAEIVKVIKGTKMDATLDKIIRNENNFWVVNGIVSGATNQDFKDYYTIAQAAYNKAK